MGASEVVAVFNAPEHADIVTKPSNQGVGVEFLVNSRVITCVVKRLICHLVAQYDAHLCSNLN
jgi:hypothetical protein